jgi:hypothetical protein
MHTDIDFLYFTLRRYVTKLHNLDIQTTTFEVKNTSVIQLAMYFNLKGYAYQFKKICGIAISAIQVL